jgi:two-component system OmpR family sensor kinase/two-component system sensor histidine kinase BaeS
MDRLWIRLTLAFVAVIAITLLTVAVFASKVVGTDFQQYLMRRDEITQSGLIDSLAAFYQQNGQWNGVDTVLANQIQGAGQGKGMMRGRPTMLVADAQEKIVYDSRDERTGSMLTSSDLDIALPILNDNQTIGFFLMLPGQGGLLPADRNFLDRLQGTLIAAAIIAGGIGIAVGLFISRTVAKPLSTLAFAAGSFGAQNWSQRVPIKGTAEVRQVGTAFNLMADSLEQADQLRRNLMAEVAHELRTPLTVMQGTLHAMIDDVYPINKAEITIVYDETRLLSRLVDDVRELALADAGQLTLALQSTNLNRLVQNAVDTFAIAADAQNLQVIATIPDEHIIVNADPDRLGQILHNLLANALRHTHQGCIHISVVDQTEQSKVRISISDTGDGILADDLSRVFDRFYRGHSGIKEKGSGLGLAITKAWVTAMKGEIGVNSVIGKGSEFWFTLPTVIT